MQVEQHAAGGDCDRDRNRGGHDELPYRAPQRPSDDQCRRSVERRSGRRMAARERRPERCSGWVQRRPEAPDELLDAEHGRLHAGQHDEQEEKRPEVPMPDCFDEHEHHCNADDDPDAAELGDCFQAAGRG